MSNSKKPVSVRLSKPGIRAVRRHHPWVFDEAIIHNNQPDAEAGRLVVVYDEGRKMQGLGLYDPHSPIRIKMLHFGGSINIDDGFFADRVKAAAEKRAHLVGEGTSGYRVVHGENDGLPGLIVDRYGDTAVIKSYSAIWWPYLDAIVQGVKDALGSTSILLRLSRNVQKLKSSVAQRDGTVLFGGPIPERVAFIENNIHFLADPIRGQKTGFFLDQRDNRAAVEALSAGADVLNVFSYSGGFSVYAARGGAKSVVSLDSAPAALADAERHFELNATATASTAHETLCGDAFAKMRELAADGRRFDVVIIDPPSFAKRKTEVELAIRSYRRLCGLGIDVLVPGGHIVLASCSSRVTRDAFLEAMTEAAIAKGRPLHAPRMVGHALDHPETFPEAAYLKCIYATA